MWRRTTAAAALVVALSGCQSSSTATITSTSPRASLSPAATRLPSLSGVSCRLPISNGTPGSGGFIAFPGGQFAADATSNVKVPGHAAGGRTSFGLSYDKGFKKWLPVPYDWVSPDGMRYVYPMGTTLAVTSVTTNEVIQVLGQDLPANWWPLDVENNGVWATQVYDATVPDPDEGGGLWLMTFKGHTQPSAGALVGGNFVYAVRGSIAYLHAQRAVRGTPVTDTIGRSDGSNGQGSEIFISGPGKIGYEWVGVAADTVFLIVAGRLIALPGANPTQTTVSIDGDLPSVAVGSYPVLGDSHGIWIAGEKGLYVMTSTGVFAASDHTGVLAGGCA